VKAISPYTEAYPVCITRPLLCSFGNVIGHAAHWKVEKTRHHLNLFAPSW
jgi:hypothetical protein